MHPFTAAIVRDLVGILEADFIKAEPLLQDAMLAEVKMLGEKINAWIQSKAKR